MHRQGRRSESLKGKGAGCYVVRAPLETWSPRVARDCWQSFGPTEVPLGDCAAVLIGGVDVVLITKRTQALGLELFGDLGIDPRTYKLVIVKSSNHFMAAFGPIAKKVIYVESGGLLNRNYRNTPHTRVNRPIWPLDDAATPGLIC